MGKNDQKMLRHSGRPPEPGRRRPAERSGLGGTPRHIQSTAIPVCKRSGPTPTAGHISAKCSPGPPGARGELRTHSHLMIQVPPAALPSLPRTKQTALTRIKGRGHGTLCRPEPWSGLLCAATASSAGPAAPSLSWPRVGGRAHSGVEEREGDRASPSVNSQDRWARLEGPQGWSN